MTKELNEKQIAQRKKVQGKIAQTTGALGLTSLGAFGASKLPSSKTAVKAIPKLKKINPRKAENVALGTSTAGAGIGGAGAFNFASYTNAEGKKVKKSADGFGSEDLCFGEIGKASTWTPTTPNASPEQRRKKRNDAYRNASAGAGGALGGLSAVKGADAAKTGLKSRRIKVDANTKPSVKGTKTKLKNAAKGKGKTAGLLAGGSLVALGASEAVNRKQDGSWKSYS